MNGLQWMAIASIAMLAAPATAQERFDSGTIEFPVETTIEFEFVEARGANQSEFGVINLNTDNSAVLFAEVRPYDDYRPGSPLRSDRQNDFIGTVEGGTVRTGDGDATNRVEFTFAPNTPYVFYLESVSPTGQTRRSLRSSSALSARFAGDLDGGTSGDRTGVRLAWDDDGLPGEDPDSDFDDFIVEAGGYLVAEPCPPVR